LRGAISPRPVRDYVEKERRKKSSPRKTDAIGKSHKRRRNYTNEQNYRNFSWNRNTGRFLPKNALSNRKEKKEKGNMKGRGEIGETGYSPACKRIKIGKTFIP